MTAQTSLEPSAAQAVSRHSPFARWARAAVAHQATALIVVIVIVAVLAQSQNDVFFTGPNIISLFRAGVTTFVVGVALTLVFTGGGIDMSVGAVFTLGSVTAAGAMVAGIPWVLAVLLGLAAGAVLGALNAVLIIWVHIPPIIATLATLYGVTGLVLVATGGSPITPLPATFDLLGQSSVLTIPLLIVYAVIVGGVFWVVLARTKFGYDVKSMGGNERAALSNGVPVVRLKIAVYAISGLVAALAGIIYTARTGTSDPQVGGTDITFAAISAVLVGGTSLFGGIGTIAGTALGAILFAEVQNALTVAGVNPLYQNIVIGVILAAAVATDSWRRNRAFRVSARR